MAETGMNEAGWRALAARSGRTSLSSLKSHSDDGLAIGPLYQAGDGPPLPGRMPGARWTVVQRIDDGDADTLGTTASQAIKGGATGLAVVFADSATARRRGVSCAIETLVNLAAAVAPDCHHLRIDTGEAITARANDLLPGIAAAGVRDICIAFDPIATLAARGWLARPLDATVDALLALGTAMDEAGIEGEAVVADGRPWHDAGATEAEELAAVLAAAVAYLRRMDALGMDLERAARRLGVVLAADADQFLVTAKFRAICLLLGRILELTGVATPAGRVHAESSWRMMSRRDPHLNMLRATSAVIAAAIGGADSVTALPFDLGSDAFANRMARNIQTISLDEAALFRVGDPGAGSGAIEALTAELAAAAWAGFQAIEREGGLLESIRSGALQQRIAASRQNRLKRVARREIEIVGVNVHIDRSQPHPEPVSEQPVADGGADAVETVTPLESMRLAEPFEQLCDRTHLLTMAGARPTVFLAGIGKPTDFSTAAGMAAAALATGGIEAIGPEGFDTPEAAGLAFRASNAALACIVADGDIAGAAIEATAAALKAAGAQWVVACTGAEPKGSSWPSVDDTLGPRTDLPTTLARLLDVLR